MSQTYGQAVASAAMLRTAGEWSCAGQAGEAAFAAPGEL